jgi:hypothetical protein
LAALFGRLGNDGEKDERVIHKIVYAISSYSRGNYLTSKHFFDAGGVDILFEVCKRARGNCKRIYTLFSDLTDVNMMDEEAIENDATKDFIVPQEVMCRVLEITEYRGQPSSEFARKVAAGECVKTDPGHDEL